MLADLKRANYTWVFLGMGCGYLAFIFRGLRWSLLLQPMGYTPKPWNSIHSVAIGYLANLAVPRLGEVTRCTVMNRAEKISVDKLFGTVLAERIIDLLMLGVCFLVTLIFKFDLLKDFVYAALVNKPGSPQNDSPLSMLLSSAAFILLAVFLLWKFREKLLANKFAVKVVEFFKGVGRGILTVLQLKNRGLFILYTLGIWLMYFLMSYLYFLCLPETEALGWADGLFVMIIGSLGIIAPAPGGIGAFHAAVIAGLLALGINKEIGGTFAIIVHSSQTLMTLFGGSIALILLSLGRKKSNHAVFQ